MALFRAGWRVLYDEVAEPARRPRGPAIDPASAATLAGLAGDCPCLRGRLAGTAGLGFIATEADVRAAQSFLRAV